MMKIHVLCSSEEHPVWPFLEAWVDNQSEEHVISLIQSKDMAAGGDILFMISCNELISSDVRNRYRAALVIHASDLPEGKGWSPHVWQIIEGRDEITLTLFEAVDAVDAGPVWKKERIRIGKHELFDEINAKLFAAELSLMDYAVRHIEDVEPLPQKGECSRYYPKRKPEDSQLDPVASLASQFNRIRVADPVRYPAYFELHGCRYALTIKKI